MPHARLVDVLRSAIDGVRATDAPPERLYTLLDAVVGITTDLDLHSMVERIVDAGRRLTGATYGVLAVRASGSDGYREHIVAGLSGDDTARLRTADTVGGFLRGLGTPGCDDRLTMAAWYVLEVPVQTHDGVFGDLFVAGPRRGATFTSDDWEVLRALAAAGSVAMGNARMLAAAAQRQRWLEAAAEITELLLAEEVDSQQALHTVVSQVRTLLRADLAVLCLRDEPSGAILIDVADGMGADQIIGKEVPSRSLAGAVLRDGRRIVVHDSDSDPRTFLPPRDWNLPALGPGIVVPLTSGARMYGVLEVFTLRDSPVPYRDTDAALAEAFAGQAALALDRVRAGQERQLLAIFEERDRIARNLHDVVIQRLFGAGLKLQSAARMALRPGVTERLEAVVDDLDATIQEIRRMIFHLHTPEDNHDLRTRLTTVVAESAAVLGFSPTVAVEAPAAVDVADDLVEDLLAVVREALSNCVRHAEAREVEVTVSVGELLTLTVTDDGAGAGASTARNFDSPSDGADPYAASTGGMRSMRERAERRGGTFIATTRHGGGTYVSWQVPVTSGAGLPPLIPCPTFEPPLPTGTA